MNLNNHACYDGYFFCFKVNSIPYAYFCDSDTGADVC